MELVIALAAFAVAYVVMYALVTVFVVDRFLDWTDRHNLGFDRVLDWVDRRSR